MARRPVSRQGLQAISMVIQPSITAAIAITAVTTAPIGSEHRSSVYAALLFARQARIWRLMTIDQGRNGTDQAVISWPARQ